MIDGGEPLRNSGRAWLVVVAAFAALFTVFGVAYSFGAFFEPISAEFGAGRGASSVIFSLTSVLFFALGAISGPASDRIGPRPLLLVSAAALGVGLAATAAADRLWVAYLTYGVGVGIGAGCAYAPMLATVGGWRPPPAVKYAGKPIHSPRASSSETSKAAPCPLRSRA